ncbi:hypothetical protein [Desulforhopalus sp. IMCC35007]|uniref:hypothetical protein n=1 Tax=Desulforhopalus sp. IMCC35007 TaxID=2569543 RepID=UPI0010AE85D9|nr:hypothetical protein [Desulforhopalus sp. IMCC35007]TKB09887.1 hypothetical protein FCL48_07930 [Desulforhopalus sp. IMCC35007]
MENAINLKNVLRGVSLSLIFIALYHFLVTSLAVVDIQLTTDNRTKFKIYYSDSSKSWSEDKMAEILIKPGKNHYSLRLANLKKIKELRIDTSEEIANVQVEALVISQPGFVPIQISSPSQFEKIVAGGGIEDFSYSEKGFLVKPSSQDPNLFYQLPPLQPENIVVDQLVRNLLLALLAFAIVLASGKMAAHARFLLSAGLVVLTLIAVMAGVSKYNQHPDEEIHVNSAKYYIDHNIPPQIGDPAVADTYSPYGMSRLNTGEISYFFAGKFARILEPLQLPNYLVFRYFNVCLFAFLLLIALYKKPFRLLLVPLLLSPQIWYIFSYFNSEGFALVVILLVAYQMVVEKSAWNRLLTVDGPGCRWWELAGIVILLIVLLLLKVNFYFFGVFIFLYFLWRLLYKKTFCGKSTFLRVALVALAGLSIFAGIRVYDSAIYDFKKSEKILEAREMYAHELYKPSTPLDKKLFYLQMKDRGITLKTIIKGHLWAEKMFRTSFGEYGYTSVAASLGYYDFVRYLAVVVFLVISFFTIKNGGWEGVTLLLITVGSAVLLATATLYHSWTVDFQAQGRYLLPVVGMLSVFAYQMREKLANLPSAFVLSCMFLVSLYSFIFVGLAGIAKTGFALG